MVRARWVAGAGVALAAAGGVYVTTNDTEPEPVFCSNEGLITASGEILGRSNRDGCQFVNAAGQLAEYTFDGQPICYDAQTMIVACDQPGARPPG